MTECDMCANLYIDDDGEESCEVELDEDEYARYLTTKPSKCPYFVDGDEYKVVRSQM